MKSFDEVTKALSICGRHLDCEGCPYENVSYPTEIGNTCKDIMHYDALYYMQDRIDKYQEANPALTWDELKAMEGKPVWVEHKLFKGWRLVGWQANDHMMILVGSYSEQLPLFSEDCGDTWNAYRKERR